jgi:hypothetical protein
VAAARHAKSSNYANALAVSFRSKPLPPNASAKIPCPDNGLKSRECRQPMETLARDAGYAIRHLAYPAGGLPETKKR